MDKKILLPELSALLALATGKRVEMCGEFLKEFFSIITEELEKGESVKIKGFGTFRLIEVDARNSVNVATGESYRLPGYTRVSFVPAKELAAIVNGPFEAFEAVEISELLSNQDLLKQREEEDSSVSIESVSDKSQPTYSAAFSSETEYAKPTALSPGENVVGEIADISVEEGEDKEKSMETLETVEKEEETCDAYNDEEMETHRFLKGFLTGLIVTLLVVAGIIISMWYFEKEVRLPGVSFSVNSVSTKVEPGNGAKKDEVQERNKTSIDSEISVTKDEVETKAETEGNPDETETPVYDTVTTTRYLTTIAREHYGNFNLWPLIYEENKRLLGHPDRIKPGTRVVVPSLSKYGIDAQDKRQVDSIKKIGVEIYSRYR